MRIAVTGASGFVGHALARRLPALGHEMVAVSRGTPPVGAAAAVRWTGVHDTAALATALRGADALVHLAARVHIMRETAPDPLAAFRAVNVNGARAAAGAAHAAGIQRALFLSTIKVLGEQRPAPYTDADAPAPHGAYAVSKLEAEEAFTSALASHGWTILRPCLVYGPGVGGNFARLLHLGVDRGGLPLPLGRAQGARSLMYVDNLADAIVAALTSAAAVRRTFVVADAERPTTASLLRTLGALAGRRTRLVPVPASWVRGLARAAGRPGVGARLFESLTVDASGFREATAWTQGVSLEDGLARCVTWWQRQQQDGA